MFKFILLFSILSFTLRDVNGAENIIDGEPADIKDYPYMGVLLGNNTFSCACVINTERTCLTAAHCVNNVRRDVLSVRVGSSNWASGGTQVKVRDYAISPFYVPNFGNDIAVVLLANPLVFSDSISSIALTTEPIRDGELVYFVGWGSTTVGSQTPVDTLKFTTYRTLTYYSCLRYKFLVPDQICTNGKNLCIGDSGGPLVSKNNGKTLLYGTAKSVVGCDRGTSTFENMALVGPWIQRAVNGFPK